MTSKIETRKCAFSLIELLVVIAVIGILAAILVPAVGNARKSAMKSESVSNMRQVFTALSLYSQDNKGVLPCNWIKEEQESWWKHLNKKGYFGDPEIWTGKKDFLGSPAVRALAPEATVKPTFQLNGYIGAYDPTNPEQGEKEPNRVTRVMELQDPAKTALLFEGKVKPDGKNFYMVIWRDAVSYPPEAVYEGDSFLLTYADGHVGPFKVADLPAKANKGSRGSPTSPERIFWRGY